MHGKQIAETCVNEQNSRLAFCQLIRFFFEHLLEKPDLLSKLRPLYV